MPWCELYGCYWYLTNSKSWCRNKSHFADRSVPTDGFVPLLYSDTHIQRSNYCSSNHIYIYDVACSRNTNTRSRTLRWRHNGRDRVSNHQPHDCLVNRLFRPRSKKTSKLRVTVTGLCAGNSPETGEFPAQVASDAENVFIWWRHHESRYNLARHHTSHQNNICPGK